MAAPPRSNATFPIKEFIDIPANDVTDSINAFVNDVNFYLALYSFGLPASSVNFAQLPASAAEGTQFYVLDGRKIGEPGIGTGVLAYFSNGQWRIASTDAPVTAAVAVGIPIQAESGVNILDETGGQIWSD